MLESVIYTGVELEIMQLADIDALNLLYASGELPDLIYYSGYTGGEQKAIKDKIIQPLNDYMQYAPDLQAVMDSNELYKKSNTTMDGDIIGFPFIRGDDYLRTSAGLIIRQDWLDDLNIIDRVRRYQNDKQHKDHIEYGKNLICRYFLSHHKLTSPNFLLILLNIITTAKLTTELKMPTAAL